MTYLKRIHAVCFMTMLMLALPVFLYSDEPSEAKFAWKLETTNAGWQARDSSGEAVFKNQLWILGGWYDSFSAPPRDVWSSEDGVTWKEVLHEAPWKYSDLPMATEFRDQLWLMGGWYNGRLEGHGATNEVWSTENGTEWKLVTPSAGWTPRLAAGLVSFQDKLWIAGGTENYYFGDERSLKNDVWWSSDGKVWKAATEAAEWAPRAYHQLVAHDGKLWVLGGGNYVPEYSARNDVWCSEDGVHWTQVTSAAPWSPRLWFSAVSWRGYMWVLGGWSNNPSKNWGDVWYSRDGKDWKQLPCSTIWKERHEHSAFVKDDQLWIVGGHAQPLSSEVWSLSLPSEFKASPKAD